jgi:hypothetical protein
MYTAWDTQMGKPKSVALTKKVLRASNV